MRGVFFCFTIVEKTLDINSIFCYNITKKNASEAKEWQTMKHFPTKTSSLTSSFYAPEGLNTSLGREMYLPAFLYINVDRYAYIISQTKGEHKDMAFKDEFMSDKEAAADLGITAKNIAQALGRLKMRKKNPLPYYALGKKHFYPRADVKEWKRKNVVRG